MRRNAQSAISARWSARLSREAVMEETVRARAAGGTSRPSRQVLRVDALAVGAAEAGTARVTHVRVATVALADHRPIGRAAAAARAGRTLVRGDRTRGELHHAEAQDDERRGEDRDSKAFHQPPPGMGGPDRLDSRRGRVAPERRGTKPPDSGAKRGP